MRREPLGRRAAGTSLVEALVAMAIMAFGMLAVVGIQATLRLNADVAKQRSEAVRIAQEAMETARGFSTIATTAGRGAYADIGDVSNLVVRSGADDPTKPTNTTFLLSRTVVAHTAPDRKEISVRVAWTDRAGTPQQVELLGVIGANDPAVSLALGARPNGIPERQPLGRHPAIPPQAVPVGEGLSGFKPPGPSGDSNVVWVFNDLSAVIVGVCNTVTTGQADLTSADVTSCSNNANGLPLSGFVRFATEMIDTTTGLPSQPTASDAENPSGTALNLATALSLTSTGHASPDHACYTDAPLTALTTRTVVRYFCAVFFQPSTVPIWSGISTLIPLAFLEPSGSVAWTIAANAADADLDHYRVCRYTPATSDAQTIPNRQHPRQYSNVTALDLLTDQNFLVIRAGNGTVPFTCPTDVAADPATGDFVNSNTLVHQPAP
jgi:Tfp pilus assembly protein PilV